MYLIGGRGATVDTPTDRIIAINPKTGTARQIGKLPRALSDLTAVTVGDHVVIAGGKDATSSTTFLGDLRAGGAAKTAAATPGQASAASLPDVYAATRIGILSPTVRRVPSACTSQIATATRSMSSTRPPTGSSATIRLAPCPSV